MFVMKNYCYNGIVESNYRLFGAIIGQKSSNKCERHWRQSIADNIIDALTMLD
jgi:hypothetical protein